jgi:hypothetical protein
MRRHVVLLTAVLLPVMVGGCMPDQSRVMAACQSEVMRFYPVYIASDLDDPGTRYIVACMKSKGYDLSVAAADCDSKYALPTQPTCYAPQGFVAATIDRIWRPSRPD